MKRIATWAIEREERRQGVSLDYLRDIAAGSTAAILKLALLAPFASHRKRLPKTAYHIARIAATRSVDRGGCAQIAVNLARKDGVPENYLRALTDENRAENVLELPAALREVVEYTCSVVEGWDNPELRESLRTRYGTEALTELAFAIASAQIQPTVKRALGHGEYSGLHPAAISSGPVSAAYRV